MIRKLIKNIDMMLLIIILIASVGFTINEEKYRTLQIAINGIMVAYFVIRIIQKKPVQIIQSKLDIFVIAFSLSTIIPLVTNTYISLKFTVMTILEYLTLLWIYILSREIVQKSEKRNSIVLDIIILITIILIFLGIENLTTNKLFDLLKLNYIINGEARLTSIFGNPNMFAVLIGISHLLCISKMIDETQKLKKIVYAVCNTILMTGLILTYSKFMFLLFPIILIIYMITIKDKAKNICVLQNIITSLIVAVLYSHIFQILVRQEQYFILLLCSMIVLIISILLNILNFKLAKYIEKTNVKYMLIVLLVLAILSGIWIKIELGKTREFVIFNEKVASDYNSKIIRDIEPEKKYIFYFDMNANIELVGKENIQDAFTINIIQRDNRNIEIKSQEIIFGNFSGIKEIEVETTKNTSEIKIEFKSKYKYTAKRWTLNELKINDKEVILEYKNLPTKLVGKIKDINFKYKTAQERFQFVKDGLKLVKEHPITGMGRRSMAI